MSIVKKSIIVISCILGAVLLIVGIFFMTKRKTSDDTITTPELVQDDIDGKAQEDPDIEEDVQDSTVERDPIVENIIDNNPYIERTEEGDIRAVPQENDITEPEEVSEPEYNEPEFVGDYVTIGIQENLDSIEDGQKICAIFSEMYGEPIVVSILSYDHDNYYCVVEETQECYSVNKTTFVTTSIEEIP